MLDVLRSQVNRVKFYTPIYGVPEKNNVFVSVRHLQDYFMHQLETFWIQLCKVNKFLSNVALLPFRINFSHENQRQQTKITIKEQKLFLSIIRQHITILRCKIDATHTFYGNISHKIIFAFLELVPTFFNLILWLVYKVLRRKIFSKWNNILKMQEPNNNVVLIKWDSYYGDIHFFSVQNC